MPPQSSAGLTQAGGAYAPTQAGWEPQRRFGFEGTVLAEPGLLGILGMFAQPYLSRMMGQIGMTPTGLVPDQNVYDTLLHQRFTRMQMEAVRTAAAADHASYMRTFRGIAALFGTPWGAAQRQGAGTLADAVTTFAPTLVDMAPDFLEQLGGARGSAAVLARRMIDAGRYRMDPVSGRFGMTGESTGRVAMDLYQQLYDRQDLRDLQGVTAGQLGGLFDTMVSRGLVAASAPTTRLQDVRSMLQDPALAGRALQSANLPDRLVNRVQDLSAAQLDRLAATPEIAGQLRTMDTSRISRSLQNYIGVVAAMRDIFGDLGRPNAPMQELINGLEALTLGGLAQFDPRRLATTARTTYGLARLTGVPLDAALLMQQQAAVRANQLGIEPVFGVQAMQGALAFGGAYNASGMAANTFWGALNPDQLRQLDQNLRTQASASPMANRLAVLMRMRESLQAGSTAAAAAAALQIPGATDFLDPATGRRRSFNFGSDEFVRMLTQGAPGLGAADVHQLLGQTGVNREFAAQFGAIQEVTRRAQGPEQLFPFVTGRIQESLTSRLAGRLMQQNPAGAPAQAQERAAATARQMSERVRARVFALDEATYSDVTRRNQAIGRIVQEELATAGAGGMLAGMNPAAQQSWLSQTANLMVGHVDTAIATGQFVQHGNLGNIRRVHSAQVFSGADQLALQVQIENMGREAMTPLGQGGFLRRIVGEIQATRPGDPDAATRILAAALGGTRTTAITEALQGPLTEIQTRQTAIREMEQDLLRSEPGSQRRADLLTRLNTAYRELSGSHAELARLSEQFGMGAHETIEPATIARALRSHDQLARSVWDVAGLRGGFGAEVSDRQREDMRRQLTGADRRPLSAGEAAELIEDQRRRRIAALEVVGASAEDRAAAAELRRQAPPDAAAVEAFRNTFDTATMTPEDVNALVRFGRRQLPGRASEADVQTYGYDLANMRLLQQRLGIEDTDIDWHMAETGAPEGGRADAIRGVIRQREAVRFTGTPEERARRQRETYERFNQFMASPQGAAQRQQLDEARQDIDTVAGALVSPGMTSRLGTRALEMHDQLVSNRNRLNFLARRYAGGSLQRLHLGNLSIDVTTQAGVEEYESVREEVERLQSQNRDVLTQVEATAGRPGRQWRLGSEAEARRQLGLPEGELTAAQQTQLTQARVAIGNEIEATLLTGLAPGQDLFGTRAAVLEGVGIARQLTPQQEDQIRQYERQAETVRRLEADPTAAGPGGRLEAARTALRDAEARIQPLQAQTGAPSLQALVNAAGISARIQRDAGTRQQAQHITPERALGAFLGAHGLGAVDQQAHAQLLGRLTTPAARRQLLAAAEARTTLQREAQTRPGRTTAELITEYNTAVAARGDDSAPMDTVAEFRRRNNLTDESRWARFTQAAELQQHFDLLRLGPGAQASDLDAAMARLLPTAQTGQGGQGGSGSYVLSGSVSISNWGTPQAAINFQGANAQRQDVVPVV